MNHSMIRRIVALATTAIVYLLVTQTLAQTAKTRITGSEMKRLSESNRSRGDLFANIRQHADLLSTQFDMIEPQHRVAADHLATWISKNYQPGKALAVIIVCTGNSRRSILGATMGNIAAAYYGLPDIRFYSGGTKPSAFNSRTVATLKAIGVKVKAIGTEAPRGSAGDANPIYRVQWGEGLTALEFSKLYSDAQNPQKGFAAIMVCDQADAECPLVKGASKRIAAPYVDPKEYDGTASEAAKYAERRDDLGRFMLSALKQVHLQRLKK